MDCKRRTAQFCRAKTGPTVFRLRIRLGVSFISRRYSFIRQPVGGYGAIRVNNRDVIPVPFSRPYEEFDILIGDWYNADHWDLRASLDDGNSLPMPNGILVNGLGPNQATFDIKPGATYRLRISNVGMKTSLNFRIQDHVMQLVETEGSYTLKQYYNSLDIHVGQSYSVLITAKNGTDSKSYFMVASSRFTFPKLFGVGIIRYPDCEGDPVGALPPGPLQYDYRFSMEQVRCLRWDLLVGAARSNPQGSYHYGIINVTRTIILENDLKVIGGKYRYTVNGISFVHPDTPLKLADCFQISDVFEPGIIPDTPDDSLALFGTSVIDAKYHDFIHVVFQNPLPSLQTWHTDGYNFFVFGMDFGRWNESKRATYNMVDAVSRSTVQVYPRSWTAIMIKLDNQGMWDLRSQNGESWYLGQELYIRVKGVGQEDPSTIPSRDEAPPIPANAIKCGRVALT